MGWGWVQPLLFAFAMAAYELKAWKGNVMTAADRTVPRWLLALALVVASALSLVYIAGPESNSHNDLLQAGLGAVLATVVVLLFDAVSLGRERSVESSSAGAN